MKTLKLKKSLYSEIPEGYTGKAEWPDGSVSWHKNKLYHKEGGPAFIDANNDINEPNSKTSYWAKEGLIHREDGPAVIFNDGTKNWALAGNYYSREEWFELLTSEQKLKALCNPENF